ncbi:MAG: hypothetical protein CME88_16980 [Hirschia sp.]|nr:hypothetical protein [Hirschia sp.]MBF20071.1 hypothetical protein [Hirschia sp.]|tara:strand:- start:248 stop:823 length:576 start_codon:yes stop_codon:yes gene_type:complete
MSDRDPLQTLWTQQKEEEFTMSLADVQNRASTFQSTIRRRNLIEYLAAALVVGIFAWMVVIIPVPVVQIGAAMIAAGAVYVAYKLHTLAGAGEPDMAQSVVTFHRAELVRQRDALKSVWRWYLAPFIPGVLVFVGGTQFSSDINMPLVARLLGLGTSLGIFAVIFGGIFWLNQRAAKKLDAEIVQLDEVEG